LTNIDVFRIQFSELFKLSGERADGLRRDMADYVHSIAKVIKAGQKDGSFIDIPPTTQALLILGMCNGTTDWYTRVGSPVRIDEIADFAARIAIAGVQGAPSRNRR
jgi:hypothetical protein